MEELARRGLNSHYH